MPGQDFPRDWNGRPQILPPPPAELVAAGDRDALIAWANEIRAAKKLNSYTRATTYVGALEDGYHIEKWKMRLVAEGVAANEHLMLAIYSVIQDRDPADPESVKAAKKELDALADKAFVAAGGDTSSTKGTAVHLLTEKIDRGEKLDAVPSAYKGDLDAYRYAVNEFGIAGIEKRLVQDELKIAGTADRFFVIVMEDGRSVIGDVKTGSGIDLGIGKIIQQLAVYSRCEEYDLETGERTPLDIDQDRGLVVHLPVGTGRAEVWWVDLNVGWRGVQLSGEVREFRKIKFKDVATPYERQAA